MQIPQPGQKIRKRTVPADLTAVDQDIVPVKRRDPAGRRDAQKDRPDQHAFQIGDDSACRPLDEQLRIQCEPAHIVHVHDGGALEPLSENEGEQDPQTDEDT